MQAGTVIATLQQLDTMKVDFTVPEQQIGGPAYRPVGELRADGGRRSPTRARSSASTRRSTRRRGSSRCAPRWRIRTAQLSPGQFARVRVQLPPVKDVIALPQTAVVTSLYGDYVYVVRAGRRRRQRRRPAGCRRSRAASERRPSSDEASSPSRSSSSPAAARAISIEIAKGLAPGQTVVTSGPEQARQQRAGDDQQQHRSGGAGARRRRAARSELLRDLHPPAGPHDRHRDPDPAARRPGLLRA